MRRLRFFFLFLSIVSPLSPPSVMAAAPAHLRPDHYASVCPDLQSIVRESVRQSMARSPVAGPATLRLFFHDCAVKVRKQHSRTWPRLIVSW
jgi:peroxidase